jgi:hypothetical protein
MNDYLPQGVNPRQTLLLVFGCNTKPDVRIALIPIRKQARLNSACTLGQQQPGQYAVYFRRASPASR